MTLRAKLVIALALLAAVSTVTIGFFSYKATSDRLTAQIDSSLNNALTGMLAQINRGDADGGLGGPRGFGPDQLLVRQQVIASDGTVAFRNYYGGSNLPVGGAEKSVARSQQPAQGIIRTVTIGGEHYRLETVAIGNGVGAVQAARSIAENERVLGSLRDRILIAAALVVLAGGLIGWWIAMQVTRRLTNVTNTAEQVAQTGSLDVQVPVQGKDEAARLGVAFNEMLAALARSKEDQQRLVQDAGHELRTPLTSLRTNTSVLRRHELSPAERAQVLDDLDSETRELTDLVNELVELATDRSRNEPEEEVRLADLAKRVAVRAERRSGRTVGVDADDSLVVGRRQGLERAISNLVDNALKFDESGSPVEVTIRDGTVTVLDRGPGIEPGDQPHLFDRFFRSIAARSRPGSGLGLSIVRDVAERHGGSVFAERREGGGSAIGFRVPLAAPDAEARSADWPAPVELSDAPEGDDDVAV